MFIRDSLYNTSYIITVWAHTTTVRADKSTVYTTVKQLPEPHILCAHTELLCVIIHFKILCANTQPLWKLLKHNFQSPIFIRGSPYIRSYIHKQCVGSHNHCVGRHNYCEHYWKTTFRVPCLAWIPPIIQHT